MDYTIKLLNSELKEKKQILKRFEKLTEEINSKQDSRHRFEAQDRHEENLQRVQIEIQDIQIALKALQKIN